MVRSSPFDFPVFILTVSSAILQAGGLIVVLVEIFRKNFLASIVPVIVNAILNEHHVVADIVAFVGKGDFPRSRLGEKQRGKILASWVTRKMRTIAQFSIRDPDGGDSSVTEIGDHAVTRTGTGLGSVKRPSSLQYVESASNLPSMTPNNVSELPGTSSLASNVSELPALEEGVTPTDNRKEFLPPMGIDYLHQHDSEQMSGTLNAPFDSSLPTQLQPGTVITPGGTVQGVIAGQLQPLEGSVPQRSDAQSVPPPEPSFGRKPFLADEDDDDSDVEYQSYPPPQQGGGLRVANYAASNQSEDDWPQEALMHMNIRK